MIGSSPLSRGIPRRRGARGSPARIIPALAGNTGVTNPSRRARTDHPRSRGEYSRNRIKFRQGAGSSPLSRGIQIMHVRESLADRIIPALAGNTAAHVTAGRHRWDHPRSRGEYWVQSVGMDSCRGSSPLSRGILRIPHRPSRLRRIIPALAGNTRPPINPGQSQRDHPRSRGEYAVGGTQPREPRGSSPLSRGIQAGESTRGLTGGIIPALAGNTRQPGEQVHRCGDHPRSRGEYRADRAEALLEQGSSPLSRGIPRGLSCIYRRRRIIPALAGNTPISKSLVGMKSDHPRSRGEYIIPDLPT